MQGIPQHWSTRRVARLAWVTLACTVLSTLSFGLAGAQAQVRVEELRFIDPNPDASVIGFELYIGGTRDTLGFYRDLRKPPRDGNGVYRIEAMVPTAWAVEFALRAYNAAGTSGLSNSVRLLPPVDLGPQTPILIGANGSLQVPTQSGSAPLEASLNTAALPGWELAGRGDFDGDGVLDLVFADAENGEYRLLRNWPVAHEEDVLPTPPPGAELAAICDLDGDGRDEIAWWDASAIHVWDDSDASDIVSRPTPLLLAVSRVGGAGDLDGDGRCELLLQQDEAAFPRLVLMRIDPDPFEIAADRPLQQELGWDVVGVADFDADGRSDVWLRNPQAGRFQISTAQGWITLPDPGFRQEAFLAGDLDRDGRPDLYVMDLDSGALRAWLLEADGRLRIATAVGDADTLPRELLSRVRDSDGDGYPDRCGEPPCDAPSESSAQSAPPLTLRVAILDEDDDAEESRDSGDVNRQSSDLELGEEDDPQVVAMRFQNVTLPKRATIVSARLEFWVDETTRRETSLEIRAEAADDASRLRTWDDNLSSRPSTSSVVRWEPPPWETQNVSGPDQHTPDLSSLVQEVVDRGGWASGNAMVFLVTGSGSRVAESANGRANQQPVLVVQYSP